MIVSLGNSCDPGILPRSLDVMFNSFEGKQYTAMNLKPRFFQDVVRLTDEEEAKEITIKENVMKMANCEVFL